MDLGGNQIILVYEKKKKQRSNKIIPNDILLYSYIGALFSHHQRSFLLQQMKTNTETHGQTLGRRWETLEYSALNGMSPLDPSLHSSEKPVEEKAERVQVPEGMEDIKRRRPSKLTWAKLIWTHRDWSSTQQRLHGSAPCPLFIYYGFQFGVFMSVQMSESLILMLFPGLFSFCLSCPTFIWLFLFYPIIFYFVIFFLKMNEWRPSHQGQS